MFESISRSLHARSAAVLITLEERLTYIFLGWTILLAFACMARMATGPAPFLEAVDTTFGTYSLLVLAPIASGLLALHWCRDADRQPQPSLRLARLGRWREVGLDEARQNSLYGTSGIMVSLLVGMLLNVPFRTVEFLLAVPPITLAAPPWVHTLQLAMAVDAVLFSSLYIIAFVTALKRVALFPRLLAFIWLADLFMQLLIAQLLGAQQDLPLGAADAVHTLLYGAVTKVLIGIAIWLPYLLLSKRVNVTYRRRIPA